MTSCSDFVRYPVDWHQGPRGQGGQSRSEELNGELEMARWITVNGHAESEINDAFRGVVAVVFRSYCVSRPIMHEWGTAKRATRISEPEKASRRPA